jgi:hypothetical protein
MSMKIGMVARRLLLTGTMAGAMVLGSWEGKALAFGGTWTIGGSAPEALDTCLLLTDGRVMMHGGSTPDWFILSPDVHGNYANGTLFKTSMPSTYAPLYFASAVLADGKMIVAGGEFNCVNGPCVLNDPNPTTDLGYLYDPQANTWTKVNPPSGWTTILDAPSAVLTNGTFLLGNAFTAQSAQLNESALSWTATGTNRTDSNNEEGWTLLPNGEVLTVTTSLLAPNGTSFADIYDANTQQWTLSNVSTPVAVATGGEIGPALLLANGLVFQSGATGHTALYNPSTTTWTAGPDFPVAPNGQLFVTNDAPAVLLPNGNVLLAAGPGPQGGSTTSWFEYDGSQIHPVASPPATAFTMFNSRMLVLPNGQVLETDSSATYNLYTPVGSPNPSWAPNLPSFGFPSTLTRGNTYTLFGTQFNGLSQANAYGDDAQDATNYPLARIKNNASGHVFYARTHNHDWMGVASGNQTISTQIDVPASIETGPSTLSIVANGIASTPVNVTVQ